MLRSIENQLVSWKSSTPSKPLILRGARQVGKSYVVTQFGQKYFESFVMINFEFERKYLSCFETLDPEKIIAQITLMQGQSITPGKTLLFLDEVQECPQAILALRYFKEKMPNLHVIAAGSLLEFTLNNADFRMPVGRVQSLYMKPCSFSEYLVASGLGKLKDYLSEAHVNEGVLPAVHDTLNEKLREYFVIGGMPEVISHYLQHKDLHQVRVLQGSLLEYYRKDFGKYDKKIKLQCLQEIFDKAPYMVAENFKYVDINPDMSSRDIRPALDALIDAGLIYKVLLSNAAGLPLSATTTGKKFKTIFLDVGLVQMACDIVSTDFLDKQTTLLNHGALTEQFVGQELLAYAENHTAQKLYYWERGKAGSTAEVDYIFNATGKIYPVEVKTGKTGRLRSLQIFLDEKKIEIGIKISENNLSFHNRVLSVPLYMVCELPRLVLEVLQTQNHTSANT